jgi:hypothetical protein
LSGIGGVMATPVLAAAKAGALQIPFYPISGGSSDNVLTEEPTQGKVMINTPDGNVTLILSGTLKGLLANHFYTVWVRNLDAAYSGESFNSYLPLGYYLLGYFTTNENGMGNFHLNILAANLPSDGYEIQVAINDVPELFPLAIGSTVIATPRFIAITTGH